MFLLKVSVFLALSTLSACEPPAPTYGVPFNNFGNHAFHEGQDPDHNEPKSYEFGYAVKDDYSGNDYKRREASDGNQVNGEYRVQLPDGRTQIVTYYADWQTGFHADVRYEGTASYPEQYGGPGTSGFQGPSGQYGAPGFGGNQLSNQYGAPFGGGQGNAGFGPASSSVTIKDFSGPGTPYNLNNQQYPHADGNNYDSYASGNFGIRSKPGPVYGAP